MKNSLLFGLLTLSTAIYAEHHDTGSMHSHEGHIHNEMVDGKTLDVDAQRFDTFMIGIDNNTIVVVSVQGMVCDFCARGIEKTFSKDKRVSKIDVDLASGKVLLAFSEANEIDSADIRKKILNNGLNTTDIQIVGK
ncbi:heavy-metal-associated domain-containing protein [Porticoccaceae bacterium]|jgi:copper chaperone CopZ|nr:heavy-metal-associated domain-containing protein [Porticoccaceae bacterium]MDB2565794.1 heavy-metal-associated domain-containing protein [Porticoccaceae bacterium]MDB2621031.1 heavy-metal-associated domain-containing protein [Porticoccaceae bacterium]